MRLVRPMARLSLLLALVLAAVGCGSGGGGSYGGYDATGYPKGTGDVRVTVVYGGGYGPGFGYPPGMVPGYPIGPW